MNGTKLILGLLVLVAITISTSAQEVDREYCSQNFTGPEECLCKAKTKWENQDNKEVTFSVYQLLDDACKTVS